MMGAMTQRQRNQWRTDRDLIQAAATKARRESSTQQNYELCEFVAMLDELAQAAAHGELHGELRRVTLLLAQAVLDGDPSLTQPGG